MELPRAVQRRDGLAQGDRGGRGRTSPTQANRRLAWGTGSGGLGAAGLRKKPQKKREDKEQKSDWVAAYDSFCPQARDE